MPRLWITLGALFCFVGVAAGAFGAHALKTRLSDEMLNVFEVGVRYQMYHGLALLFLAWAVDRWPQSNLSIAGWFFTAGIAIFSGSLYILALTGIRWLGAVTPIGGLCLLAGWLVLVLFPKP